MKSRTKKIIGGTAAGVVAAASLLIVNAQDDGLPADVDNYMQVVCPPQHQKTDDPIVYPDQPGVSHNHQFFGNPDTNAFTTNASLVASKKAGCSWNGNFSAYWIPVLYRNNVRVQPDVGKFYYRDNAIDESKIKPFPVGLRMITGNANATTPPNAGTRMGWRCGLGNKYDAPKTTIPSCGTTKWVHVWVYFPDCWDGKNLDSTNHQSHMAFAGPANCPSSHPVRVPQIQLIVRWPIHDGQGVTLASGQPMTMHADFMNGWDQPTLTAEVKRCLNPQATNSTNQKKCHGTRAIPPVNNGLP